MFEDRQERNQKNGHGHRGGGFAISSLLDGKPDAQLLFVGALSCTRHRGFQMGELMREGRMAVLCPTATDYATGRYLNQMKEAVIEIALERNAKEVVLMYGCQCAVLSTDYELMKQQLREEYGIRLTIHERCHLCGNDEEDRVENRSMADRHMENRRGDRL